jgi:predicted dienelactone hydrolase
VHTSALVLRIASALRRLGSALAAFASIALLVAPAPAFAANEEATRIGGVDAVVWSSTNASFDPQPVVVFSHAMHMCPTQSRYLTRALADAGYLVIAPRHTDSNCRLSIPELSRNGWKPSLMWSDDDFRDRADDVRKLVAALPADARFKGSADVSRLALVGHSLGGYTVLGLGGAWPSWKLPGVRAILAFTPYSLPFQRTGGLRKLSAPVMYQAGTLDQVFTLPLNLSGYDQSPAPKYFVEFTTAAHLAWTDLWMGGHDEILDYALAFFDHYVKGAPAGTALRTKLPGVLKFAHAER